MVEIALSVFLLVSFFVFSFFLVRHFFPLLFNTVNNIISENGKSQKTFYEMVKEMQVEHSITLEKLLAKQNQESEKRQEKLFKLFDMKVKMQAQPTVEQVIENLPNDIDKQEEKEIPITEGMKIPITDQTKVKFEDEEIIGDELS